jgi:hypothetical protein
MPVGHPPRNASTPPGTAPRHRLCETSVGMKVFYKTVFVGEVSAFYRPISLRVELTRIIFFPLFCLSLHIVCFICILWPTQLSPVDRSSLCLYLLGPTK